MSTIIDRYGRLHIKVDNDYQLVEDAPLMKYSYILDRRIAITQEGDIFDVNARKTLEVGDDSKFIDALETPYYWDDELLPTIFAIKENGELWRYKREDCVVIKGEQVATDVRLISEHEEIVFYVIDNSIEAISCDIEMGGYDFERDVIGLVGNLIITDKTVYAATDGGYYRYNVDGRLIGAGIQSLDDGSDDIIHIIQEVEGELDIRSMYAYRLGDTTKHLRFHNKFLDEMHEFSKFTEVVKIGDTPYLLNASGRLVRLGDDNCIGGSGVPDRLMRLERSAKNPRSRID